MKFRRLFPFLLPLVIVLAGLRPVAGQSAAWGADSHPTRTTANHAKRVIGYVTQWDQWKGTEVGLPVQGYLNHLNIDYSQYTHLNFSFFGVASNGTLHSADFRNKNLWQTGAGQPPAPLLYGDVYSSWDYWILYGDLSLQWDFSNPATTNAGFVPYSGSYNNGNGTLLTANWSNTLTGLIGPWPVPLPSTNAAPGLLALAHAKGVKVMASIGGWSMCKHYPAMAADPTMRARFTNDCQRLMKIGFDGIDFDWEYPGPFSGMNFTGSSADYTNFLTLIQQVRTAIGTNKEISLALSCNPAKLAGFNWPALASLVDSLDLMTYDIQGGWSATAGHNAPLASYPNEEGGALAATNSVMYLLAQGVPPNRIAMGVPFYGRGVVCSGAAALNAPTVPAQQTIQPDGPITTSADFVNWPAPYNGTPDYYYLRGRTNGWTRFWDPNAGVPYWTNGSYFLSYDDSHSVGLKAQYVRNQNLGGVIIWHAFGDLIAGPITYVGSNSKLSYSPTNRAPLINVVNSVLAGDAVPPDGTEGPVPPGTLPYLSVANAGVVLPASGLTNVLFPVSLSAAATSNVTVQYFTSNGTATAASDYYPTNGTLVFSAGQLTNYITVVVPGSAAAGSNKVFYLTLSNAVGATLPASPAVGTLTNNNSSGGSSGSGGNWPAHVFAPYVDFSDYINGSPFNFGGAATNTGLHYVTLGFVVADSSQNAATAPATNIPSWGNFYPVVTGYRTNDIAAFRALGGDVIVSFGGQANTELALYITDTNRLKAAYQFVIDRCAATRIDFDIEGAAVGDSASINRRSAVMAALQAGAQAAGRTLQISLTLPVLPTGLDYNGVSVVRSAVTNGVELACVNIMTMDYGNAAPNPAGHMGDYAIQSATNLFGQLKQIYQAANIAKTDAQLWHLVGVTPMLGYNDDVAEIFDQPAAGQLVNFAASENIGLLSFWSLNRDRTGASAYNCSGINNSNYEFTGIFLPFGGSGGGGSSLPYLSVANAGVVLPASGLTNVLFPVSLSAAATSSVTVQYFTSNGTATAASDYYPTNGTLVFSAGQLTNYVTVVAPGSAAASSNKVFYLTLSNAVGATLPASPAVGTLTNNNSSSGGGSGSGSGGECALSSQWLVTIDQASFRATLTLINPNATNITLTTLAFDAPWTSAQWIAVDAALGNWVQPTHVGNHFTASGWNTNQYQPPVIPAGGSLVLTIQGAPGGNPPGPTNLMVNGVTVGHCDTPPVYFTSVLRNGSRVALTWETIAGYTNIVQVSHDLITWSNASPPLVTSGSGSVTTNWVDTGATNSGPARFYRLITY